MRNCVLAIVVILLLSSSAFAGVNSQRKAAEELLEASNSAQMVEQLRSQIEQAFQSAVAQMNVNHGDREFLNKYTHKMSNILLENIKWETMKDQLVNIYAKVYTESEIKELTAFYKSPTGKKLISKMPELIRASMEIGQKQMENVIPKLEALTQEMQNELEVQAKQSPN